MKYNLPMKEQYEEFFSHPWIILAVVTISTAILNLPLLKLHTEWLFHRCNSLFTCKVSAGIRKQLDSDVRINGANGNGDISISQEELEAFAQDVAVLLRNVISNDWLRAYWKLLIHVYKNPSWWDILYSRLVANFYGAQKSIFLHQPLQ